MGRLPARPVEGERLICRDELLSMVPYTIQHIYRLERRGKFPKRVHVGPNRVAWLLSEVNAWIGERVAERHRKPGKAR